MLTATTGRVTSMADVITEVLRDSYHSSDSLRALLAALPAPSNVVSHTPVFTDALASSAISSISRTNDQSLCSDEERFATPAEGTVPPVTVGALFTAAMQAGSMPSSATLDDFVALLLSVSPLLLRLSPSTAQLSGLVCRLRHLAGRSCTGDGLLCAQRVTAGEAQEVLRHVLVSWQPWVDDTVYTRLCRDTAQSSRANEADALVSYLYTTHTLHRRAVPMRAATPQYVEWLLQNVPPYYVPLAFVRQGAAFAADAPRSTPGEAGRTPDWTDVIHDAQHDKLLLAWSADGALLRLRAPPQSADDYEASLVRHDEQPVRSWAVRSARYTASQRYALLPHHPELFHAALRLLVHVVPTYWVTLASVHGVYVTAAANEAALTYAGNSALDDDLSRALHDRFPTAECLLGHPDLASALAWDAATADGLCRVRLHPHLAHTDRGVADTLYDGATASAAPVVVCREVTAQIAPETAVAGLHETARTGPALAVPPKLPDPPISTSAAAFDDYLAALQASGQSIPTECREPSVAEDLMHSSLGPSSGNPHTTAAASDTAKTEREELICMLTQEAAALYQSTPPAQTGEAARPVVLFDAPTPTAPTFHRARRWPGLRGSAGVTHFANGAKSARREGGGRGEHGGVSAAPPASHGGWPPLSSVSMVSCASTPSTHATPRMPLPDQAAALTEAREALRTLFDP